MEKKLIFSFYFFLFEVEKIVKNTYFLISIVLGILFLGSLGFSMFLIFQKEEVKVDSELDKLNATLLKLQQEKKELKKEKEELGTQLKKEILARPVKGVDKDSPFDHVKKSQVNVLSHKVEIDIKNVNWWKIADTNSMDPLLDIGTTALSVKPQSEKNVHVGDVAFYNSIVANKKIVHRVVNISSDQVGWYSRFKGDNLEKVDPEDVRFKQILGVLIGIIY